MSISTNIAPYYNDFDDDKNFHQILFRPGFAVQARELTQLQSILRGQIEKFGNHIFQQGSIVIPGNSRAELGVPYAKIESTFNGIAINPSAWLDKVVVGATSGVTAIIKHVEFATSTDPVTFYLSYISGGVIDDVPTNKLVFDAGENLYLASDPTTFAKVQSDSTAIGQGSIAYINKGVYYVNGTFVTVAKQQTVISKYDTVPSCHVLLKIDESFVTSDDDSTLLDPAQGSYNFAAPGADRLKIDLTLTSIPIDSAVTEDYVEIMRYREGVLEEHARTPKYNELEKSLARRTYDESGNYVVSGLVGKISEHLRENSNGGISATGSRDNFALTVTSGKAYITGFETEKISDTTIILPKARTADHVKNKQINLRPSYGRYILVSDIVGGPKLDERQSIDLYNDDDASNVSATKIGTARVLSIDYHIGDPASNNAIYKLYVTDVVFSSVLYSLDDAGGIRYTGGSASVIQVLTSPLSVGTHNIGNIINYGSSERTATVRYWNSSTSELYVFKHDHTKATPRVGDQIVNATTSATSVVQNKTSYFGSGTNSAIIELPVTSVKSVRNQSNIYDYRYSVQKTLTITTNASGNGSVSISNGTMQTPEAGTFAAFSAAGVVSSSLFTLNVAGNTLTLAGGPVSTTVRIFVTVDKVATIPRTKTLLTFIDTVTMPAGQTTVSLTNPDVYRIVSIADATGDVTNNYTLNSGQTDFAYFLSSISLKSGAAAPSGNIVVQYEYFDHSSGDFFIYDSYSGNTNYDEFSLYYTSNSTGKEYNLKNCIDLRPSVNSSNDFSSGAIVGDALISGELITSSVQYYVSRYDVLTFEVNGTLKVVQGVPDDNPIVPVTPSEALAIEQYYVPAYTESILDIKKIRLAVDRFTMKDIADLSNRVGRLEEFSTLNASESSVVNYDVIDAETGLTRFKTGYLVETFNTPLTIANIYSDQFSAAFDHAALVPAVEEMDCPAIVLDNQSSGYQNTNGIISLPYTESRLISQPLSSRVTNLNPFLMISWDGVLSVTPNSDSWIEILDLPSIVINKTETTTITRFVNFPGGPSVSESRQVTTSMPVTNLPFIRSTGIPTAIQEALDRLSTRTGR